MLINSGDEGGCRKTIPFFYVQTFLVQIPSGILFGKTYYNAKQYWEGDDRYDLLNFFNKVLTN
jgi:hypothetical protein